MSEAEAGRFVPLIGPHAFPLVVREDAPFTRDDLLLHLESIGTAPTAAMFRTLSHTAWTAPR